MIRLFMVFEAVSFGIAALIHSGLLSRATTTTEPASRRA
jgi:hypothetical protein